MLLNIQIANQSRSVSRYKKSAVATVSTLILIFSAGAAYASIPVYECAPCYLVGYVDSPSDLFNTPSGTPVALTDNTGSTDGEDMKNVDLYEIRDADTCSVSVAQRQNNAISALNAAGLDPPFFSFIRVDLADGNIDFYTRSGGAAPNYWSFTYSTCN